MKISTTKNKITIKKALYAVVSAVFWIAVWGVAAYAVDSQLLVASPARVAVRLFELGQTPDFWLSVGESLFRIVSGFALGALFGVLLAGATAASSALRHLTSPLILVIRATPVASFIILTLVFMEKGQIPVFISFLMVLPIVWGNISQGIQKIDKALIETARVFNVPKKTRIFHIYVPSVMPYFTAACKTSLGLAWKAGVAAEVLCRPENSIGGKLYDAKVYLETADVFAWTLTVIVLSLIIEQLLGMLMKRVDGEVRRDA